MTDLYKSTLPYYQAELAGRVEHSRAVRRLPAHAAAQRIQTSFTTADGATVTADHWEKLL